jgi:hypothetical protein
MKDTKMKPHEELLMDLGKFYNHYSRFKQDKVGGNILKSIKDVFHKATSLATNVLSNEHVKKIITGCIKKVVGAGSIHQCNIDDMGNDLCMIYQKHSQKSGGSMKTPDKKLLGGFLGVLATILSMLGSAAVSLSPMVIDKIKKCVMGSIEAISGSGAMVRPVRYDHSNFKSSFQADDEPLKFHQGALPRVGGVYKNKWLEFCGRLKKGETGTYKGNKYHRDSSTGKIVKH